MKAIFTGIRLYKLTEAIVLELQLSKLMGRQSSSNYSHTL